MFNSMVTSSSSSSSDPSPLPPLPFSATPSPFPYASSSYPLHRSYSTHSFSPPFHAHYIPDPAAASFFLSDHRCRRPPPGPTPAPAPSSPSSSSSTSGDYPDFNSGPFSRRVFSAGDLQGMSGSQAPSENCGRDVGGSVAMKAARYTAEERKERVERYRIKRHQRNFHKKITYACRKTLADTRPRVRGRFARNGDAETAEAAANGCYESFSNYDSSYAHQRRECINLDGAAAGWGQNSEGQECCFLDEDLWVNFADVFPLEFPY